MSLRLSGLLLFLVVALPSGSGLYGNQGVKVRTCTKLEGVCFFGFKPGWTWVAYCHNIMSCCTQNKIFLPPQSKQP